VRNTFTKAERLKSKTLFQELFETGQRVKKFPVQLVFIPVPRATHHQAAFAVPKRNFKSAVARNRIKRQLREAYRLHKNMCLSENGPKFALLFIYIHKKPMPYDALSSSMAALLKSVST
tara:strand:- start:11110 stop:11466 length:357 start_codon:yes stop_codon:yes gene_type:complete